MAFRQLLIASLSAALPLFVPNQSYAIDSENAAKSVGKVSGMVRLDGERPALPDHPVYKHVGQCGTEIPDERLVVGKDGGLANVLVHVVDAKPGGPIDTDRQVVLDNRRCVFVPHVLSASRGQTLSIRNSDPFLHDAHAWLGTRTLFNVALPKGKTVDKVLTDPGLIQINCNVRHTWMRAYVFVGENPYHTVTDGDGRFEIGGLPAGTYTLRFWHELLGNTDRGVAVRPNDTATVDVVFRAVAPQEDGD